MAEITCFRCEKTVKSTKTTAAGTPRLPGRWTKVDDQPVCPNCKETKPVKNYTYGAKPPVGESAQLLDDQMRLAGRLRNDIVRAELDRRGRVDQLLAGTNTALAAAESEIAQAEAALETVRATIRAANSRARAKTTGSDAQKARAAELRTRLKTARDERKRIRTESFSAPTTKTALKAIDDTHAAALKDLYARYGDLGLYWGSRLHVLEIAGRLRKGPPPEFVRFRGDGHVAVQVQNGATAAEVMGDDCTQVQIRSLGDHPKRPHAVVRFRVGSLPKGKPKWAELRIRLHRPLPADGLVKNAHVIRTREGYRDHWSVMLSVENPGGVDDRAVGGTVGIDLGWRRLADDSVRVASIVGSDGHTEELRIPARHVAARLQADHVQGVRDELFNTTKARLLTWIVDNPLPAAWTDESPENPHPIAKALAAWKSPDRLRRLVRHWEQNRLPGDEEVFGDPVGWRAVRDRLGNEEYATVVKEAAQAGVLLGWFLQDRHLKEYQVGLVRRAVARRKMLFQLFVVRLRRRYMTAVVEDINWREEVLKKPEAETDLDSAYLRKLHRIASPGLLLSMVTAQVRVVRRVPAADTTCTCHACREVCTFNAAAELYHTCEYCGVRWDQDDNAARNLLATSR